MKASLCILGSGPSTGVPLPTCRCAVCRSGKPRNERLRSSAAVLLPGHRPLLIDTSPDLRQQALRYGITGIEAVLFTHAHADHILGFDDLRSFNFAQRQAIPCYGAHETLRDIKLVFRYAVEPDPDYKGGMLVQADFQEISRTQRFRAAGIEIQAFPLRHGDALVTGFRFGSLAYATDCSALTGEAREILSGVEHLVIDGLRLHPHATHFNIAQAIEAAAEVNARRVYLTHLSHSVEYDEVTATLPPHVELAYDGLTIEFEAREA